MSEFEYYTNTPYTNFCKLEGYLDKEKKILEVQRFAAWRIHQSLVSKPLSINKFWPIDGEQKQEKTKLVVDMELWKQIKANNPNIK